MLFFSPLTIQYGPWSPSKYKTLTECAYKFKLDSQKFVPEPGKVFSPDSTALDIGNSVHKYAELITSGSTKQEATLVSINSSLTLEHQDKVSKMREGIDRFNERIEVLKGNGCVFDSAEVKAAVDRNLRSVGFFDKTCVLRGKIDRAIMLDRDGGKHIVAIDYKTGKMRSSEVEPDHAMQLEFYGILLHSMYPEVTSVQPCLYFVEEDKVVWHTRKIYKKDIIPSNPVFTSINKSAEEYGASQADIPKTRGRQCDWCKYKLHCATN
jgi:RecB family exonuclease